MIVLKKTSKKFNRRKTVELEINRHHPRGNAILAGPLSDFDEILCRLWIP